MPLVRFEVRNEYKLGGSHLYNDAVLAEDPKPVLDGLTVAGLVGILRQLGDLAEFAAEVFHGLQEQVASTSSRSRKLVNRVQRIEASLPQLEKAILSQTSHIHYAYTPGCSLHARIRNAQNHFVYNDLPSFIMDPYEECREPPRLQLLDRFDTGGPGSCLRRYSDPTFFRKASTSSEVLNGEKSLHERKARRTKRRRTRKHTENSRKISPFSKDSKRVQSQAPIAQGPSSVSHTESTIDTTCKSDMVDSSDLGSKDLMDYIEREMYPSSSMQPGDTKRSEPSSVRNENMTGAHDSIYVYGQSCGASTPSLEETVPHSSVTDDDKMVTGEHIHLNHGTNDLEYLVDDLNGRKSPSKSDVDYYFLETPVNDIQDAQKENVDLVKPKLRLVDASVGTVEDSSERESVSDLRDDENYPRTNIGTQPDRAVDEAREMTENYELHEHDSGPITTECIAQVEDFPRSEKTSMMISDDCLVNDSLDCIAQVEDVSRCESSLRPISDESPRNDSLDRKWETIDDSRFAESSQLYGLNFGIDDVRYMLENFEPQELDLGPVNTEYRSQVEELSRGENYSELISDGSPVNDPCERKLFVSQIDDIENDFDTVEERSEAVNMEPVSQMEAFPESENAVTVIEWNQHDDVDSETDQFVDALNTIESESESDFEGQTKKELVSYSSCKDELVEYAGFVQKEELIEHQQPDCEFSYPWNNDKENDIQSSNALASSVNMESLGHTEPSCNVSVAAMISLFEPERKSNSLSFDYKEEVPDPSSAVVPMEFIEHDQSSNDVVEAEISQLTSHQESERECDSITLDNNDQARDSPLDSHAALSLDSIEHPPQLSCDVSAEDITSPQISEVNPCDVVSDQTQPISDDSHTSAPRIVDPVVPGEGDELDRSTCLCDEQSVEHIRSSSSPAEGTVGAPHPVALWTNGTLFGLQPSKPTFLSSPNTESSKPISKTNTPSNMQKVEDSAARGASLEDPGLGHGSIESKLDTDSQDTEYENSTLAEQSMIHCVSNGRIADHEVKAPSTANVKNLSTKAVNTRQEKPSLITLLGRELLRNGLRAGSFDYADKSNTNIPIPNELEENISHSSTLHSTSETISKEKLNSPPPSPPLDHMKISFRPFDGFGTSRLKLKYPEGIDQHESIVDSFPSFQLVPEPSNLKADAGSDSDDDTFCRSYTCMSDDYLCHLSDSNSDEWESGETSESNNDSALYDGLRRISSTEFASSSPQCEETDQKSINVCSISGHVVDLPTLGSQIPFSYKVSTECPHTEEIETLPFPTVLDPKDNNKQGQGSHSFNQPFRPNLKEPATATKTDELDEQQLDPRSLNNEVKNVGRAEDEDDFLRQIRTKSVNLRHTETAQLSYMPNNATNNKVTAILQKANAIRQVVASDGDDDSWSDT